MFDQRFPSSSGSGAAPAGAESRPMKITPLDLRQQRFKTRVRGFDQGDVIAFLTEAADEYEQALRELDRLRQRRLDAVRSLLAGVLFLLLAWRAGVAVADMRRAAETTMLLGIPLWRQQQRISKQLQSEEAGKKDASSVLWAYLYRGDELHMHGTPRDLDQLVPDGKARKAGLAKSPGGYTGEVAQFGYWYGYGVRPLRVLGPDVGAVVFRMEPK